MTKQKEMKKYRVSYYVSNERQIKGEEPHSGISDCEFTVAEDEEDAIYNIVYWIREHASESDDVKYTEIEDRTVKCFNYDDECFEEYEVFDAELVGEIEE